MPLDHTPCPVETASTRERLRNGTLLSAVRADPPPGMKPCSDAELEASLARTLREHPSGSDLYVFGYGSLMWNPALEYTQALKAYIHGWRRSFCLRLFVGRGSLQKPGLMMGLDRGEGCHGIAFRIPAAKVHEELRLLWRREMAWGSYEPRWVDARSEGQTLRVLTFVVPRHQERYAGALSDEQVAEFIATGRGSLGTCRTYFESTLRMLETIGVNDAGMERIRQALAGFDQRVAAESGVDL